MSVEGYFTEGLPDDVAEIIHMLQTWGCCARCVYRFLGNKDQEHYQKPLQQLQDALSRFSADARPKGKTDKTEDGDVEMKDSKLPNASGDSSKNKNSVCICCLGILQECFSSPDFLDKIHQKILQDNYQFSTFFVSLTVPVPIILRENSVWLLLKEHKPAVYCESVKQEVAQIKEVWKWSNSPGLEERLGKPFDQRSPFEVQLNFKHEKALRECNFLLDIFPKTFKQRKQNKHGWELFTRANVAKALSDMSEAKFQRNYQCPARSPKEPCECNPINCAHEALYIAGRYNKYSRNLSQTPWLLDGERKTDSSIEEQICDKIKDVVRSSDCKFSSSGREDVDVKTLGNGRPFLLELTNPRKVEFSKEEMKQLQLDINGATSDIAVRDLQTVPREETTRLKEGEIEKKKSYSALCWSEKTFTEDDAESIAKVTDLKLMQKTPIRVLHRRPLAVRERVIHSLSAKSVNDHHFMLYLSTQAGTYIKEFVHGDFGRTAPSLGELLKTSVDILELNVESVDLDWPPKIDDY